MIEVAGAARGPPWIDSTWLGSGQEIGSTDPRCCLGMRLWSSARQQLRHLLRELTTRVLITNANGFRRTTKFQKSNVPERRPNNHIRLIRFESRSCYTRLHDIDGG
jgi:hypothetical protein